MSDTKVSLFKKLFPVSATSYKLSQEKCNVKLKLLDKWGDCILNDLIGLFGVPGDHLHLSTVEQGSTTVTWLCSSTYIKELKGAIIDATDVLQTKGVLQVFIKEELVLECPQSNRGTSCSSHYDFYEITLYSDCIADMHLLIWLYWFVHMYFMWGKSTCLVPCCLKMSCWVYSTALICEFKCLHHGLLYPVREILKVSSCAAS